MSIKKKFATAVATASLLAGLFGSAFVPSAMGAVILPVDTVVAKYTTLTEGPEVKQAGSAKVFGFQTEDSDDGAVDADAYIDIALFTAGAAGAGTDELDMTDADNAAAVLKATSSNSAVNVGWGYDDAGADAAGEDGADVDLLNDDADTFADAVACSGNITVGTTSSVKEVTGSDNDATPSGVFRLCFASETVTTAATSTITITWDGAVVATFTVTAVGPVASLTASITGGYKYVAEDNNAIDAWFTIIAKDAAGVQINGASTSISNETVTVSDWADQVENVQESQIVALGANIDTIGTGTSEIGYELESGACTEESGAGEDDGDAGSSYALKFEHTTAGGDDVVSNAVTITCTLNSDGARVTAVTPEATSGADVYTDADSDGDGKLNLVATVVDANGVPLGDGANILSSNDTGQNFEWEFDGDADLNYDRIFGQDATSGLLLFADMDPGTNRFGRFSYTLTATDSNLDISNVDGDDPVEKEFAFTYTAINSADPATITKVRNAAKTSAVFTADMGEDAAFELVYFTIEKANGNVVEYARRANAIGVAKLTLSRRNTTIYVYASESADTDVIKCVFK